MKVCILFILSIKNQNILVSHSTILFVFTSFEWHLFIPQVKNIHQEKKLDMLVDKDLKSNYDRLELEEMVQVALLCTQFLPGQRPKMSEVVRMLEGDGLAERWEASQRAEANKCRPHEFSSSERYSDLTDDSSLLVQAMELSGPRWIPKFWHMRKQRNKMPSLEHNSNIFDPFERTQVPPQEFV